MSLLILAAIGTAIALSTIQVRKQIDDPTLISPTLSGRYKVTILLLSACFIFLCYEVATQSTSHYTFGLSDFRIFFLLLLFFPLALLPVGIMLLVKVRSYSKAGIPPATNKKNLLIPLLLCGVLLFLGADTYHRLATKDHQARVVPHFGTSLDAPEAISNEINYQDYLPFQEGNKVVKYEKDPTLTISSNYPRLDGATAFYPIYAAFVETVYTDLQPLDVEEFVLCTTTPTAYDRLLAEETDIIFVLEPSLKHLQKAKEKDVELFLTPIGKEGFVFFVNESNPVDSLTIEQVQKIYTRDITNWNQVGGKDNDILPFQRPENSGSQTIMLSTVMKDLKITKPLINEEMRGMGDVLTYTADYVNVDTALGYSFRYYATEMNKNSGIKVLSINDIPPTKENISNDSYPFTVPFYAITTKKGLENPQTQELIDWILSPQGQEILELTGYSKIS